MGTQHSQKRGLRSEAQKEEKARDAYEPIPPANPVRGAFGGTKGSPSKKPKTAQSKSRNRAATEQRER